MKLYMQQKVFSWRDKFAIKDEAERDRWFAQGEVFSLGRKLHVFDADGAERAFIHRKVLSFLPRYYIAIDGTEYEFVKEFSFIHPKFSLKSLGWTAGGNFLEHNYTLSSGSAEIMHITKAWLTWGDCYELDIADPKDELLCLCVALAIDCIDADNGHSAVNINVGN